MGQIFVPASAEVLWENWTNIALIRLSFLFCSRDLKRQASFHHLSISDWNGDSWTFQWVPWLPACLVIESVCSMGLCFALQRKVPVAANTKKKKKKGWKEWRTFLLPRGELLPSEKSVVKLPRTSMRPEPPLWHLKFYFMEYNGRTFIPEFQGTNLVPGLFQHFCS